MQSHSTFWVFFGGLGPYLMCSELLMYLCSEDHVRCQGWNTNWSQVSLVQSKCRTHCAMAPALPQLPTLYMLIVPGGWQQLPS